MGGSALCILLPLAALRGGEMYIVEVQMIKAVR